ncbi:hypothetical protein MATL_G00206730 [Megalops atlanticus]|uniref:C-type lectin domain-containing protein n=1 Tax=Megalops atlanticus TaxID=7932 RepID=A0A9D3PN62_MEGAT|nr:hypothetical protein MATL_G00206730 [Megalops atlanticus]
MEMLKLFFVSALTLLVPFVMAEVPALPKDGCPAYPGAPGQNGLPGRDGRDGKDGREGVPGPKGEKGDPGIAVPGPPGKAGPVGPEGLKGQKGELGLPGEKGSQGMAGPAGPSGPGGLKGQKGEPAPAGEKGSQGMAGPAGPSGPGGLKGQKGEPAPAGREPVDVKTGLFKLETATRFPKFRRVGNKYYMTEILMGDYDKGVKHCRDFGGTLALPRSSAENQGLANVISAWGHRYAVLGANDRQINGRFQDTQGDRVTFTNWGSGQPDNYYDPEECILLSKYGTWDDVACSSVYLIICEI